MANLRLEERAHNGSRHAGSREQHATSCRIGMGEPLQPKYKQDRRKQVAQLDVDVQFERPFFSAGFTGISRLNIFSMRSVMRNPPMTLIEADTTATNPSQVLTW